MGRGNPDAPSGEWKAISELLVAPLPSLRSQLLPESAFSTLPSSSGVAAASQASSSDQPATGGPKGSQQQAAPAAQTAGQTSAEAATAQAVPTGAQTQKGQIHGTHTHKGEIQKGHLQKAHTQGAQTHETGQAGSCQQSASEVQFPAQTSAPKTLLGAAPAHSVPAPHAASDGSPMLPASADDVAATLPLQQMLLEAVANKSIPSLQDINRLASATLLSHQAQCSRVKLAIKCALAVLE